MKKYVKIIFLVAFSLSFSACIKQWSMNEKEYQQILEYIEDLGLEFDTLQSGVLLHVSKLGDSTFFKIGDSVTIVYTGYNLDYKNYFAKDDTFSFKIGDEKILPGWNDAITYFEQNGEGIIIFPYDKAFGKYQSPDIKAYSTLVYDFKILSPISKNKKHKQ